MTTLDKLTDRKRRPALYAVLGLGAALLVVWLIWMSVALLAQSRNNAAIARDSNAAAEQILDCTVPGGDCFQRSEDRYATAVSGINAGTLRIIAAALACEADGVVNRSELAECTTKRAANAAPKP